MTNLDSLEEIRKFDEKGVLSSIKMLPDQAREAWEEVNKLKIKKEFAGATNVVICGMGGSALGGRVVDSLFEKKIRAPIEVFTQYYLPNYVNKNSLVIVSSYSGNTEETLSCFNDALKRGARIFGITTNGKLAESLKKEKIDAYIFEPTYNPANKPRLAIAYSIFALLAFLNKTDFITISDQEINSAFDTLEECVKDFGPRASSKQNLAKTMALELQNRIPVLVSSEHLVGVTHVFKNQLNETAKTFSVSFDLPELNHHLLEGLGGPPKAKEVLHFLFYSSKLYSDRVQKRYPITQEVVDKNSVGYSLYNLRSKTKFEQVMELLAFGSFVSFYLAFLNRVDPSEIPWVDFFKKKLSEG
ncbi:MAG: bifunctional phosphoglucose/phosphomannose isomerase [Patescibacteria group bacterium]